MYDDSYGLRFDIYERVHLSDEHIGIDQLEEVELTPHIQVLSAGEQVTVRGSLLLAGAYIGTVEDRRTQTLEHWIPVEITLPLNRIRSLEEIRVDIENFDVDLLSTRTLNITGVLSLRGIHVEQPDPPVWETEQFTVVHHATDTTSEPPWLRDYGQAASDGNEEREANPELEPIMTSYALEESEVTLDHTSRQEQEHDAGQHPEQIVGAETGYTEVAEPVQAVHADNEMRTDAQLPQHEQQQQQQWSQQHLAEQQPIVHLHAQAPSSSNSDSDAVELEESGFRASEHLFSKPESRESASESELEPELGLENEVVSPQLAIQVEAGLGVEDQRQQSEADDRQEMGTVAPSQQATTASSAATSWNWPDSQWNQPTSASAARTQAEQLDSSEQPTEVDGDSDIIRNEEQELEPMEESAILEALITETEQVREEPAAEQVELKIAIGSSKAESAEKSEALGFSSLLRSSQQAREQEQEREAEQRQAEAMLQQAAKSYSGEELNWQSLFLNRVDGEHQFSRVRMCIVQRDDTLEEIANRYQMNAREIAVHNQLADPSISEGQVLYIPTSAVLQK